MKTLRILEYLTGIQKRPNASAKRVRLIFEFLRLTVIELLFDNGGEGREALSFGESTYPATALFCGPQLISIELAKRFNQSLLERIDGFIVCLIRQGTR